MKLITTSLFIVLAIAWPSSRTMAQTAYELVITNVADMPLSSSHTFSVGIRWTGTGTNDLFNNGVNGASFGLRIVNAGSVVAALKLTAPSPYNSTTTPSNSFIIKNPGFTLSPPVSGTNFGPTSSSTAFTTIAGYTKVLGGLFAVNGTGGLKPANGLAGTILPLGDFVLFASDSITGHINLEAGFLRIGQDNFVYGDPASGQPFDTDISVGTAGFNVIAIPEPATWAMIILSIASGIGALVWFKRHHLQSAEKQLLLAQEGAGETE